jgi:two-component system response regulator PhoP
MKVLIIEDDNVLREQLRLGLEKAGFTVMCSKDGEDGLFQAKEFEFDLAIIDIGLPKISGLDVIIEIRKIGLALPILILTARSSWQDKVEGLNAGADDYLAKPFQLEELIARAHAMIRRASGFPNNIIEHGQIKLDSTNQCVFSEERAVTLTAFEYNVLEYFMRHPQQVISKTRLMDYLYSHDEERDSNVIEVLVSRLRQKLDPNNTIKPLETLRGRGYQFTLKGKSS